VGPDSGTAAPGHDAAAIEAALKTEEPAAAPRRGRKPGSKNRQKEEPEAAYNEESVGLLVNGLFDRLAEMVHPCWTLTPAESASLSRLTYKVLLKYDDQLGEHAPEIMLATAVVLVVSGKAVTTIRAKRAAKSAPAA
jgi:hypothetical protein